MVRGQVVCRKHDAGGNPIGRSNQNLIFNTCLNEVKFPGVEMTQLAVIIIAESMTPSVMMTEMNTYYWKHSLIRERMLQLSV